ncbi:MAG TPA: flagellar basal body rod protein FlgB [Telluria sp.]|jgi:flagellar basal-body rod protein FlgB
MPINFDQNLSAIIGVALDATTMRHQAIAHNIANVNTPGYQAMGVSFEGSLAQARAEAQAGRALTPSMLADLQPRMETQGGAVSLELEIAHLSENTLQHQTLLKMLSRHYANLRTAITDGKS